MTTYDDDSTLFFSFTLSFVFFVRTQSKCNKVVRMKYLHSRRKPDIEEVHCLPSLDFADIVTQASTLRRF